MRVRLRVGRRRLLSAALLALALSSCVRVHVVVNPPPPVEEYEDIENEDEDDTDGRRVWWTVVAAALGAVAGWLHLRAIEE